MSENTAESAAEDPLAAQHSLDAFVANRRGLDSDSSPAPATADHETGIKYGVRWTPGPGQQPVVIPRGCADDAEQHARRIRALQRTLGNADDATPVYQVTEEDGWMILLPTYGDEVIREFQEWLERQPGEPPAFQ